MQIRKKRRQKKLEKVIYGQLDNVLSPIGISWFSSKNLSSRSANNSRQSSMVSNRSNASSVSRNSNHSNNTATNQYQQNQRSSFAGSTTTTTSWKHNTVSPAPAAVFTAHAPTSGEEDLHTIHCGYENDCS
jgi:hypothetical protein